MSCVPADCTLDNACITTPMHMHVHAQVASSFSHMLNLHNLTEEVNASHTESAVRRGEVSGQCACVYCTWAWGFGVIGREGMAAQSDLGGVCVLYVW